VPLNLDHFNSKKLIFSNFTIFVFLICFVNNVASIYAVEIYKYFGLYIHLRDDYLTYMFSLSSFTYVLGTYVGIYIFDNFSFKFAFHFN